MILTGVEERAFEWNSSNRSPLDFLAASEPAANREPARIAENQRILNNKERKKKRSWVRSVKKTKGNWDEERVRLLLRTRTLVNWVIPQLRVRLSIVASFKRMTKLRRSSTSNVSSIEAPTRDGKAAS